MSKKVFVVDDDADLVFSLKGMLQKNGYDVETAYDGDECLRRVEDVRPDLIVLDVMMPHKHGYDVCKELRRGERTASIPVILLTAVESHLSTTAYTRHMGLTNEADDFINKPFQPEELLGRVRELIGA